MDKKVFWCKTCLNMSTRPRIEFDNKGRCNACVWSETKRDMDWKPRQSQLEELLAKHRGDGSKFDVIVPVSGGKDGSYVAYQLKHRFGMNPLCVTVRPALELELGSQNLLNFIASGYDHLHISPDTNCMQVLNRIGFIEKGFPYFGWLAAITTAPLRTATQMGIGLVFYGEDGEVEYGGTSETGKKPTYGVDYMKRVYLEGGYEKVLALAENEINISDFFKFPEIGSSELEVAHWSYFEPWDSYRNYIVAKEHCGLREKEEGNSGTFTNFAQNDQALYSLHAYMMYLKFGFGRATQDAGIEIRRGAMERAQALNLVRMYDGQFPDNFLELYLKYYRMEREQFDAVIDNFANKDLFAKNGSYWEPKFLVGENFTI